MAPTYGPKVYHKLGSDVLVVASGGTLSVESGGALKSDTIAETTSATGVTADSVLLKDGAVTASGATAAGDNATLGYTAADGAVLTGQGTTSDVTIKNDADADVVTIATGTTNVDIVGDVTAQTVNADGDTTAGDSATMGYTATEGLILTGQGSTSDITLKNDADADVLTVATGQTAIARVGGDQTLMIAISDGDYTVLAQNSGKIHLVADVSADRTFTLPTAAPGLYYEFWHTMESADGNAWLIVTGNDSNYYKGGVLWCKSDVAEATASEVTIVVPNGSDDATIQINLPSVGTVVKMYCDGTNWFLTGFVMSVGTPSYT